MVPGGLLILSEKLTMADPAMDTLMIDLHHDFKRSQGYSDLEIAQKRDAIENVLIPETAQSHSDRLSEAGFSSSIWFQWLELRIFHRRCVIADGHTRGAHSRSRSLRSTVGGANALRVAGGSACKQLAQSMSEKRYGDLKRWRESMHALPELTAIIKTRQCLCGR